MNHLGSLKATSKEREELIKDGLGKVEEFLYSSKEKESVNVFDCKVKKLAFEFAQKLNPGRGGSSLRAIYDALQLSSCGSTFTDERSEEKRWRGGSLKEVPYQTKFWQTKYFGGQNFRLTKFFAG